MPRTRALKPGFFQNDVLADVEPLGRLLFAGLWTLADRAGDGQHARVAVAVPSSVPAGSHVEVFVLRGGQLARRRRQRSGNISRSVPAAPDAEAAQRRTGQGAALVAGAVVAAVARLARREGGSAGAEHGRTEREMFPPYLS